MRTLKTDGVALLADPGWVADGKLRAAFRRSGFAIHRDRRAVSWPPWRPTHRQEKVINIYTLRRAPHAS